MTTSVDVTKGELLILECDDTGKKAATRTVSWVDGAAKRHAAAMKARKAKKMKTE